MKLVNEEKSWLEWVVFTLSSVLIVLVVGYLARDAIVDAGRPPEIRVSLGKPTRSAHGFIVPVSVTNEGDETAQAVELEVKTSGNPEETASLTYDFLSSGEVRGGWVGFSQDPTDKLTARVMGYRAE